MRALFLFLSLLFLPATSFPAEVVDAQNPRDRALLQSAFKGELENVKVLLRKGASIEATDPKQRTALMWAAANGHTPVVEFLVDQGADINARDSDGQTALMYASRRSFPATVGLLLKLGAEVNVQSNKRGLTALIIAAAAGDEAVVRLLLDSGADKSLAEIDGDTALDRARQNGNAGVIPLLQEKPGNNS
jgi:ankyrin repeat protein